MPSPLSSPTSQPDTSAVLENPPTRHSSKKTRVVRRRGRAKDGLESEDEIIREALTDSDSEAFSTYSASEDSDTEPRSEDASRITATTTQSTVKELTRLDNELAPLFTSTENWSDMVAHENDLTALPVIDFADFHAASPHSPPSRKSVTTDRPEVTSRDLTPGKQNESKAGTPASTSRRTEKAPEHKYKRVPGQTARQAYQQRLESDPTYVPQIGEFWGHDDRLLDKDLRSLSGWWRGRWLGMRGRGRGARSLQGNNQAVGDVAQEVLPPIEQAWTHDGFEEMKKREEGGRSAQLSAPQAHPTSINARGRGASVRVRGSRGGSLAFPRFRTGPGEDRVWFTMKPQPMWTKQHDAFLFFDHALKPRHGLGPGFRVRLPGKQGTVVRGTPHIPGSNAQEGLNTTMESVNPLETESQGPPFVVRLPVRASEQLAVEPPIEEEAAVEDISSSQVEASSAAVSLPDNGAAASTDGITGSFGAPTGRVVDPGPSIRSQLEQLSVEPTSDPMRSAQTEDAVLRKPATETTDETQRRSSPSGMASGFTPSPVPSSTAYGSTSYGYSAALPPGVGLNHQGMPYELATGRPVYFQPHAVYDSRPLIHPHPHMTSPYMAGHMHHSSTSSPDFLAQSTPHLGNGFIDPSMGTPLFSLPRQSSRIEIRAPTDEVQKSVKSTHPSSSGLRAGVRSFEPSQLPDGAEARYYSSMNAASEFRSTYAIADGSVSTDTMPRSQHMDPTLSYPSYQVPFYHSDHYTYPSRYVNVPHSQVEQYDMYPGMEQPSQGAVYYQV